MSYAYIIFQRHSASALFGSAVADTGARD